jgi:bifunctional DNA-binding transcriptional regulator/antitoxin component of YhaV-PrlF toxin-antitoxin module
MSRVTSKPQVTIPKSLAERYGIESGDDIASSQRAGRTTTRVIGSDAEDSRSWAGRTTTRFRRAEGFPGRGPEERPRASIGSDARTISRSWFGGATDG